jgi:tol-pal system protein YbgF
MLGKIARGVAAAALLGALGGCAALDQDARINFLEGQMKDVLEKSAEWDVTSRRVRQQTADTAAEVATIREQVQSLTGRVEDMLLGGMPRENPIFAQQGLGAEVRDLQERLQYLEAKLAELERRVSGEAPGAGMAALEPSVTGSTPAPPAVTPTPPAAAGPRQEYNQGMDALKQKKYGTSIKLFRNFIRKYPGDDLADNAQYWIGESYYAQKKYEEAIIEFEEVLQKYPKGDKVPAALLKEGLSFQRLQDKNTARQLLRKLVDQYPKSEEAKMAEKSLAELK